MKKVIFLILTMIMVLGIVSSNVSVMASNYAGITLTELQAKYPHGSVWLETFDGSRQCAGFARLMCYELYGSDYFINNDNGQWKKFTNSSYIDNDLKSGDYVRYNGHSVFVISVDGENVYIVDCNSDGACTVKWRTLTKANLKKNFSHVYSAPYAAFSDSANRVELFETAIVTARSGLTIREQPDINSPKVGYLNSNESVRVCRYPLTDSSGYTWRYLLDERGWVCSDYLNITSGQIIVSGNYKIQCENGKYITYTSSPKNGVNIVMYDDLSNTELASQQIWNFEPLFYFGDCGFIIYKITPVLNPKFALDSDTKNYENVSLWESHNGMNQQWIMEIRSDGSLRFNNNGTRLVLDVFSASTENNAEVITYSSHDEDNQKFHLINP